MASVPFWLCDLAGAWVFYSVLPAWPWLQPGFRRIARFAPWIGLVIGVLAGILWVLLEQLGWPTAARVLVVLGFEAWITGGLHHDGVMDTADGLAAGEGRRLAAMEDSRVGASGVLALLLALLLQGAALLTLAERAPESQAVLLLPGWLVAAAFWGRCAPLWALLRFPYLRAGGTAGFHRAQARGVWELLPAGLAALLGLVLTLALPRARLLLWSVPVGLASSWWVAYWLGRRLGGHTGDSYGACVVWTQALMLILLALLTIPGPAGAA
jgi:adenosylcobinamide-GDP ribazoletransferase